MMSFALAEQASAEQDEQDNKRTDIKPEQPAVEKNHKQDYNPQDITATVALGWSVSATATTAAETTAESAK